MNNFIIAYIVVGVLVASMPVMDKDFGKKFDRMGSISFLMGVTVVCAAWPLVLYVALKGASNTINKRNNRE